LNYYYCLEWMNDKRIINIHVLHSFILLLHLDFNLFSNYEMMIDGDWACIWIRWDSPFLLDTWGQRRKKSLINMIRGKEKKSLSEWWWLHKMNERTNEVTTSLPTVSNSEKNRPIQSTNCLDNYSNYTCSLLSAR